MPSQRVIIGIGLAILLSISAASIGLDVKSRNDAAAVGQTLGMLRKFADIQLLLRRSESERGRWESCSSPARHKSDPEWRIQRRILLCR